KFTKRKPTFKFVERKNKHGEKQIEIIMPLEVGMEVRAFAKKRKMWTNNWLRLGKSMLEGIRDLHANVGLYHRHIKPENMLYDPVTNRSKPIDLGSAVLITQANTRGRVGSPLFMAPEIRTKNLESYD